MKTCFPAMKGRGRDHGGYLLGDVVLVLLLLGTLLPGLITLSAGMRKREESHHLLSPELYPLRQFVWNPDEDGENED